MNPRVVVDHLSIRDFRNLRRAELAIPEDGVVLIGDNGQGKTNVIEAVYYLELLRSMRGARDHDITRFGASGFHVAARLRGAQRHEVAVGYEKQTRRKRVTADGVTPSRLSDALGSVPSVVVAPSDVQLVNGGPSERRRYIDVVLALSSRRYLVALQRYRAALARRNAALREVVRGGGDRAQIEVWKPALAENGAVLWNERAAWVADTAPTFVTACAAIGEVGEPCMRHVSGMSAASGATDELANTLAAQRGADIRRGVTQAGPHRDDIELTLDGRELRVFGSGGQQRTAAIALRMLEAATLRKRFHAEPVLLLDDPFAELDVRRSAGILEILRDSGLGQTMLAVPRGADIPPELTRLERWRITEGVVRPGDDRQ
jgi:DNA replication and repair protein RecF